MKCVHVLARRVAETPTEVGNGVSSSFFLDFISAIGGVNLQFNLSPVPQIILDM